MRRTWIFLTTGILGFIVLELVQFILIVGVWHFVWKYWLRERLPQSWVDNYYMMGFGHNER